MEKYLNSRISGFIFFITVLSACPGLIGAEITVNPLKMQQKIVGFGASGAWWAQEIGAWDQDKRSEIIELLYGRRGIGLTIYRYNIGAGWVEGDRRDTWRRAETFEVGPRKYDWSKDQHAIRMLREICAAGIKNIILCAYSPPLRITNSGLHYGSEKNNFSNLRQDMYDEYADYLLDICKYFIKKKIPVSRLSPVNEPNWNWDKPSQEGCFYKPEEVARLTGILLKKIQLEKVNIEMDVAEIGSWDTARAYVDALFSDYTIEKNVNTFAVHSYWSDLNNKIKFQKYFHDKYPSKQLHMTEWCEMKWGLSPGIDSGLVLANSVMDDLLVGRVSSWQFWLAVSKYKYRDGLIAVDMDKQTISTTKRLWALGSFSRYIRPGYQLIEAKKTGIGKGIKVLACKNPKTNKIVLVVLNNKNHSEKVRLKLGNISMIYDVYETSASHDLEKILTGHRENWYKFPSRSITTLVFN